jgi:lipopolysaccharide biosynthesis glycosyltransferase
MVDKMTYPIVLVFDNNLKEQALVLIINIYNNSGNSNELLFYLITNYETDFSFENEYLLKESICFNLIRIDYKILADTFSNHIPHISLATYYKLIALDLISIQHEYLLIHDIDVYNIANIQSVFKFKSDQKSLSVVDSGKEDYFGAGFFIINTKIAKSKYNLNNFKNVYIDNEDKIKWNEQDLLNIVFKDDYSMCIPYLWDFPVQYYLTNKKEFHNKGLFLSDAKSIHYPGTSKPWRFSTILPFAKEWRQLYFKIYKKPPWQRISIKELFLRLLYILFPNPSILYRFQNYVKRLSKKSS